MEQILSFSAEEIISQVERMCSTVDLSSKQQLCRLLKYLVDETLAGRADQLKGYTIGVELFGREHDYNTNQDPIVKIHAGRLRRMLRIYYLESGRNDSIRIDIPKGKYVPVFLSNTTGPSKQENSRPEQKYQPVEPVIAILPFRNMTGDPSKEYFALGFSEEISVELTKYEDLTIIDGIHLSGLDHASPDKIKLLRNLGVRFVIEGNVNLDTDRVKILVKLSDIFRKKQIWAERYIKDLSITNLVELQEDIAHEIAAELGSEYGVILQQLTAESNRVKPKVLDTYHAILKFYYFEAHQTPDAAAEAISALEEAIVSDPKSGIATAMLASMYGTHYMLDMPNADMAYEKMGILAEKAADLDPNSLAVRIIFCYKCLAYNEKERFFKEAEKCLEMQPNSRMRLGTLGFHLSLYGDWERGKSILDQVMAEKVQFPRYYFGATTLYHYRLREFEQALVEANQYEMPSLFWGPMLRAAVLGQLGRTDEAKVHIDHLKQLKPDFEEKAFYLISRFVKEDELVDQIIDGLRKAGLTIRQVAKH